ncbi:protein IQ-DOMAIN 1-like [Rutidosis leptorrhynchoides]|uniref:protein IQ-DOMAIN 1-like n=1 Tax=Rutidosis leptorrhynchoides TaxID=125765 RepID=UPI003A99917C
MRRERAMAYSFSHQQPWKKSASATNMLFMDPTNPQWGWSWSERYVMKVEKDSGNDNASSKNSVNIAKSEIAKSYARHQNSSAPTTPRSKPGGQVSSRQPKPSPSPRATQGSGIESNIDDDDLKSIVNVISGSMVKKGDSLPNSPAARKRMVVAKSAKAKPQEEGLLENAKKQITKRNSGSPKVE